MKTRFAATAWLALIAVLVSFGAVLAEEPSAEAPVRHIKMYAENWKWTPSEIRVPVGTRLKIEFVSRDASHAFVLKAFKIKVPLPQDKEASVEFIADKAGEFPWYCGRPCGDGCAKMRGKLIVEG